MLMVFFLFLFAGCENISGLGKVKRMEIGNPSQELTQAYMITGVPETFLIDADGILRHKFIGPYDWNSGQMRNVVLELFNSPQ